MLLVLSLFSSGARALSVRCDDKGTSGGSQMVERINQRYDDFFRYHRHLEERQAARDKGRAELKGRHEAREHEMERARLAYVKNRRPAPDTAEMEARYNLKEKQRQIALEAARECYVQQKTHAEQILIRGRMIPANKEYELDN